MQRSVQELKTQLQKVKSITPWNDVKVNEIYHIPPIISLKRRNIRIVSRDENEATYERVDEGKGADEAGILKMHRTSVFARFLIKQKKF